MNDKIKNLTEKLLDQQVLLHKLMLLTLVRIHIKLIFEPEDETGLLIGFRGENIDSIQTVLGMMLKDKPENGIG